MAPDLRSRFARAVARTGSVLFLALAPPLAGCVSASSGAPPRIGIEGAITPVDVKDADFAASVERVLRDGKPSAERLGLLVGVVRRQLAHAEKRFAEGHADRATDGVVGALYLVRAGEGRGEMIDATGEKALAGAVDRLAPRGDDGETIALLRMRQPTLAKGTPEREELDRHLAALEAWVHEPRSSEIQTLRDAERAAVSRSLVEPGPEALEEAARAVDRWGSRALELQPEFQHRGFRSPLEREEEIRALRTAATTLVAIYLRNGDAKGALERIESSEVRNVVPPGLYGLLRAAARGNEAGDWLNIAASFEPSDPNEEFDMPLDSEVSEAARWGAAVEAYRRDPKSIEASLFLASLLVHFGVPEAAPQVLVRALPAHSEPRARSAAVELLIQGLVDAAESEGPDAARRVFDAAPVVLAEADKGGAEPSSARARYLMASIEVRAGRLDAAEPLLKRAVASEPSTSGFTTLALVERQAGNVRAAMDAVDQGLRAPDARVAPLDVAEANLVAYDLHRDAGEGADARRSLDAALAAVLAGRSQHNDAAKRARAERLLGRVLEAYGETKGAARAFDRALTAAAVDKPTLGAAMLDAIGRALIRRDLVAARAALKKGIDGNVLEDDLVYGALWTLLLERQLKAPSDGTVERALHAGSHTPWTGKLAAWASGKLSDAELAAGAQTASQKVEAAFYTAMSKKVAGDPAADQRLRAVASSPVIDLLEVQLARELVAPPLTASLPGGVKLP